MPQTVAFTQELLDTHCIIDVRTPLEFAEDHLPGAVNVPILTNEERVEIGTLYKRQGPRQARMRGLELTCGRFAGMVHDVIVHADGRSILVYCWRGGLRSLSMAILLEMSGYPAVQLQGGYRAFRTMVCASFASFVPREPLIVIHGMTGTGKTAFINSLDRDTFTVIDLEGLACHRGSAFGEIGLVQNISQKRFDTLLWDAFRKAPPGRPIILEGESQRIGKISLPETVYGTMARSCKVWCQASLEARVHRLSTEYACVEYRGAMALALERIRKKLGGVRYAEIRALLENGEVEGVAQALIEQYYDRQYYKNRSWTPDVEIDLEDFALARERLAEFLNRWSAAVTTADNSL